ncbi:hypothetical protein OAB57_00950 [Bacteriovoracaceae bacterium]|nr:hypothetical protein [Bacteriovoracaceae bacterium]
MRIIFSYLIKPIVVFLMFKSIPGICNREESISRQDAILSNLPIDENELSKYAEEIYRTSGRNDFGKIFLNRLKSHHSSYQKLIGDIGLVFHLDRFEDFAVKDNKKYQFYKKALSRFSAQNNFCLDKEDTENTISEHYGKVVPAEIVQRRFHQNAPKHRYIRALALNPEELKYVKKHGLESMHLRNNTGAPYSNYVSNIKRRVLQAKDQDDYNLSVTVNPHIARLASSPFLNRNPDRSLYYFILDLPETYIVEPKSFKITPEEPFTVDGFTLYAPSVESFVQTKIDLKNIVKIIPQNESQELFDSVEHYNPRRDLRKHPDLEPLIKRLIKERDERRR